MLKTVKLPARVPDLDPGLSYMNADYLPHLLPLPLPVSSTSSSTSSPSPSAAAASSLPIEIVAKLTNVFLRI